MMSLPIAGLVLCFYLRGGAAFGADPGQPDHERAEERSAMVRMQLSSPGRTPVTDPAVRAADAEDAQAQVYSG